LLLKGIFSIMKKDIKISNFKFFYTHSIEYLKRNFLFYFIFFILFAFGIFSFSVIEIKAQSFSVFIDLKPIYLAANSQGPGLGIGWEYFFNLTFSIYGKMVYMNFLDVEIWLIYYLQGIRFYFKNSNYDKFFIGLYGIVLYGVYQKQGSISYGIQIDFGYKWRLEGFEKIFIEPQITYIYIFGEELIPGISLGLNVGLFL